MYKCHRETNCNFILLAVMLLISCVSCYTASPPTKPNIQYNTPSDNGDTHESSRIALINHVLDNTVVVYVRDKETGKFGMGSGIYIGDILDDGIYQQHILTAYHVIRKDENSHNEEFIVRTYEDDSMFAGVVIINEEIDCAVIQLNQNIIPKDQIPASLSTNVDDIDYGRYTLNIGHPASVLFTLSEGMIVNPKVHFHNDQYATDHVGFMTSTVVDFGCSGSGMFLCESGECIGILSVKFAETNYAGCVSSILIANWIEEETQNITENEDE